MNITEDVCTLLYGSNAALRLLLTSGCAITDANGTIINVQSGNANFDAGIYGIALGDYVTDQTYFQSLTFNGGAVNITEDDGIDLYGSSSASSLMLKATGGSITKHTSW